MPCSRPCCCQATAHDEGRRAVHGALVGTRSGRPRPSPRLPTRAPNRADRSQDSGGGVVRFTPPPWGESNRKTGPRVVSPTRAMRRRRAKPRQNRWFSACFRQSRKNSDGRYGLAHQLHLLCGVRVNRTGPHRPSAGVTHSGSPGDAFGTGGCRGVRNRHLLSPAVVNGGRVMNSSNMARGVSSGTVGAAPALAWFTRSDCVLCLLPISLFLPILSLI